MTEGARGDLRWVLGFALFLVLLTSLPYLIAVANQGADWVFSGFIFGVEDGHSYIAKMLRGAQGEWLFRSPYSTLPQAGALVYLPYLLLGKLFGPDASHAQLVAAFHLYRLSAIPFLCLAIYDFAALLLTKRKHQRQVVVLATLGGGLGWLMLTAGYLSLDFYSPETFGFLSIFGLPHLVLARALLLWGLVRYLRGGASGWGDALLWLALALTHLVTAAIGLLLVGAHLAFTSLRRMGNVDTRRHGWRRAALMLAGALPVFAFNVYQFLGDRFLAGWAEQNHVPSPAPWHYLLAYGLPLVFAYWGALHFYRADARKASFLITWMVLLPILLYAPIGLQRRLAEGAWVALIVLALAAFEGGVRPAWRWSLLLLLPSSLILLVGGLDVARNPRPPAFLPAEQVATFHELRNSAESDQVVLASYASGNALPAWAPLRTVIGHGPETVGLAELGPQVEAFFQAPAGQIDAWSGFVDYVFLGPEELALAGGHFEAPEDLDLFYDQGGYQIYRLIASPAD